jgi:predicted CoA-binding protein
MPQMHVFIKVLTNFNKREMKRTLIIGASANTSRYSYLASQKLKAMGHPVFLLGRRKGLVNGEEIHTEPLLWEDIDTVTLYINPSIQPSYYDYIISLKPKRVIFNPGTENREFENILVAINIIPVRACTLVMLSTSQY